MVNIPSILAQGILSHERASKLPHHSIALQPVQDKRDLTTIPGGRRLHQYANLYFHARNPMMYKRRGEAPTTCVRRISTAVFSIRCNLCHGLDASGEPTRLLQAQCPKMRRDTGAEFGSTSVFDRCLCSRCYSAPTS
ncbi:MAG: DUF4433 domain-containing protein [Alphaproteobacteria bacterium]|nr:DUF4433 domain-containing protein [Alphaproteobacteria bacterium]